MIASELRTLVAASRAPSPGDGRGARADTAVDRAVFGTDDPAAIAGVLSDFCREQLGAPVRAARFYRVSVACVAGLELADGRAVVVKAQRGGRSLEYLSACVDFRRLLIAEGFPCPAPLSAPHRAGGAWLTAEELCDRGAPGDAHDPAIRRAIAGSLARVTEISGRFPAPERFGRSWFSGLPEDRVFPRPHHPAFDFEGTRGGAEWIEALAAEARARRVDAAGERAVGHFDYRVEHLRFEGDRVVATFDWDSLHFERVAVLAGTMAPHFTADWQRDDVRRAPSIDEAAAFVADFERGRKLAFSAEERRTAAAAAVYAMAYTARCNHASNPREEGWNGDLRPLLRAHGRALLDRGFPG